MPPRKNFPWLVTGFALVVSKLFVAAPASAQELVAPKTNAEFAGRVQPLLKKYCFGCHAGAKAKGKVRLDSFEPDFSGDRLAAWKDVKEQLAAGTMPPKKSPQPSVEETGTINTWISGGVAAREAADRNAHGRVVLRRLNRVEYENTVRDLLGVPVEVKEMLPEDSPVEGFDNIAAALRISTTHMHCYLEAAHRALDAFFVGKQSEPKGTIARYRFKDERFAKDQDGNAVRVTDDAVILFQGNPGDYNPWDLRQFRARVPGEYRFRLSAQAYRSEGRPLVMAIYAGRKLVGYYDIPEDKPQVIEFTAPLKQGETINPVPYRFGYPHKKGADPKATRGLILRGVEVDGPINEIWPPRGYRRLLGNVDLKNGTAADAEGILRDFLPRAFRRPIRDAELRPYLDLVREGMAEAKSDRLENGLRVALAAALCSPRFLFLIEKPGKLDNHALASRLSYFLWNTTPDDELTRLASGGRLDDPEVLRQQVERLLRSPRAAAFTENFLGQWLELRRIDATTPDRHQNPQFDELLKVSMVRETHAFFEELLEHDRSVLNFLDSDFAMLNRPLAQMYGVPGVNGLEIHKIPLPPGSCRGGVMTQASILKITANGSSTSPVVRGVWLLKNIVGKPVPPPPPNIPAVEPDVRGATTVRELLAKHRRLENCATCHTRIDPLGFALENFDVIGAWRDYYRTNNNRVNQFIEIADPEGKIHKFRRGPRVDASDALPDGRRFGDIAELKKLLASDPDSIARCVTEKLVIYATGATLGDSDRAVVQEIVQRLRARQYGLRSLIHEVVQSKLFLSK